MKTEKSKDKPMKKTVVFYKHIHSTFAGASSNDVWAKIITNEGELDFSLPKVNETIKSAKFPMLNGLTVQETGGDQWFKTFYFNADKTFYNKGLYSGRGIFSNGFHDTVEFKDLIQSYKEKGWETEREEIPGYDAYRKREDAAYARRQKKRGIVLWKKYDELKPEDYQGGFSDELFNTPGIKNYVSRGGVFGWIGDSGTRRAEHDKAIEKGLKERGLSYEAMSKWITSSDGRHFADSLNGKLKEELEKIDKYLNTIFNNCLIYGCEKHGGTLKSSIEIREDYEAQGILLPENETSYDPNFHFALLGSLFIKDKELKGERLSVNEKMFSADFIKKFINKK
jgi:hypothetical protein